MITYTNDASRLFVTVKVTSVIAGSGSRTNSPDHTVAVPLKLLSYSAHQVSTSVTETDQPLGIVTVTVYEIISPLTMAVFCTVPVQVGVSLQSHTDTHCQSHDSVSGGQIQVASFPESVEGSLVV